MPADDRNAPPSGIAAVPGLPALPLHALLVPAVQREHGDVQRDALSVSCAAQRQESPNVDAIICIFTM